MRKLSKFFKQTTRRLTWFLYRKKRILRRDIKDYIKDDIRLHFGCGDKKLKGYINIDAVASEATDLTIDLANELHLIPSNIASEIRLESVFEHFYRYDQNDILQEFHRILKKGKKLIIMWLPDFDALIDAYTKKLPGIVGNEFDLFNVYRLSHGDPTKKNEPHQLHKDIFTKDSIRAILEYNNFSIDSLKNEIFPGEKLSISINITASKR